MKNTKKIDLQLPNNTTSDKVLFLEIKKDSYTIRVGKNCKIILIEDIKTKKTPNTQVNLIIDEGTEVEYYSIQDKKYNNFVIERKAELKKDANIIWYDINLNNSEGSSKIFTSLNGKNAKAIVYGVFIANEEKKLIISHTTLHNAPNTTSKMESKIILDDSAKADYKGLISIPHKYSNCSGEERTNVLLLSPDAKIETLPELDIGNNQVKCTHSVSISHLDKEKMFYLNSRGVDPKMAEQMLTTAFLSPIVDTIKNDTIKRMLNIQS